MYMAHERRAHILRLLAERGTVRSAELAAELGVTDESIRTDLVLLEGLGQLKRRRGGAEYCPPPAGGDAATQRLDAQLARQLLPHIRSGARLMVDASRLSRTLIRLLPAPCTLITHNPALLQGLAAPALPHRLLCPGGELDKESGRLLAEAVPPCDLAILSPGRVALGDEGAAIAYDLAADRRWAELAAAQAQGLLLACPASALAAPAAGMLHCRPALIVTEEHLRPGSPRPPQLETLPWLDPASLTAADVFDY